jgi:DNA-binding transcriptional LysR family regulator
MELRDIEYFAVMAEHGNVRRASEALGLSPTALSKSLRRLEQSLKARIVKRTPKGIELTAVGSALLAQVKRIRVTLAARSSRSFPGARRPPADRRRSGHRRAAARSLRGVAR